MAEITDPAMRDALSPKDWWLRASRVLVPILTIALLIALASGVDRLMGH